MPRRLLKNFFIQAFVIAAVVYAILILLIPSKYLLSLFNGTFVGMSFSVSVIYYPPLRAIWKHRVRLEQDDDVIVYAVSTLLLWVAFIVSKFVGIASNVAGREPWYFSAPYSVFATYLAILAALGQIYAPSVGQQIGVRTDKKLVVLAFVIGLIIALVTTVLQLAGLLGVRS